MKSTVKQRSILMTRKKMANPFLDTPMLERLQRSKSIDLRQNHREVLLSDEYATIEPIDDKKTF
jgi:hypothetical protein